MNVKKILVACFATCILCSCQKMTPTDGETVGVKAISDYYDKCVNGETKNGETGQLGGLSLVLRPDAIAACELIAVEYGRNYFEPADVIAFKEIMRQQRKKRLEHPIAFLMD